MTAHGTGGEAAAPHIQGEVLDNLRDGVLVVGAGGRIETLNPAAERILGLEAGEAERASFTELFIAREGFDDFTEMLIEATTQGGGGDRRVVEVQGEGGTRSLSVATSYLRREAESGARAVAVIAVFSDITELRELRDSELRLAKEAEEQHDLLRDAYREIEERNTALRAALRRVRVVQGLGMAAGLVIFAGVGLWAWQPLDMFETAAHEEMQHRDAQTRRLTVTPRLVSNAIALRGTLAPWREVAVQSATEGKIARVHVQAGDEVAEGQILVTLDLAQAKVRQRQAQLAASRARKRVEELENWEESAEMTAARRSFTKAELDLESGRTRIAKSRFLFEKGLIAADELEGAEREHRGQLLDFEAAKDEFESVRKAGGPDTLEEARLALEGASETLRRRNADIESAQVTAPIGGVVLSGERAGRGLTEGRVVRKGDTLATIGDFSRLAAVVEAEETDVTAIATGQSVTVTGNAFPGLTLEGAVQRVATRADPRSRGNPKFEVAVVLDPVDGARAERLRAGMSARIRIITYRNPKALLVPIEAVESRGREHRVEVIDPTTGKAKTRTVEIGPTTRDSVEISAGLEAGETIAVPGRDG